jgi:hypothetical protein
MFKKIILMVFCLFSSYCQAFDRNSSCFRDLQVNFFDPNTVGQAMNMFSIPQGQWLLAIQQLQINSQAVPQMVQQRAFNIRPNPFDYPANPLVAYDIVMQTLQEVFAPVAIQLLQNLQRTDISSVEGMFDFIRNSQRGKIYACFGNIEELRRQQREAEQAAAQAQQNQVSG